MTASSAMNDTRLVVTHLIGMYRRVALWFCGALIVGTAIAVTVLAMVTEVRYSMWVLIAGSAVKYWQAVVGVLLVSTHLRQFVSTGVTRHAFLRGAALFGLWSAVFLAALVVAGHAVEQALIRLDGPLIPTYPRLDAGGLVTEFLHVLPTELAYLVAGAAIAAGFYRYGALPGSLLIVPCLLPVAVTEGLLGRGPHGETLTRFLPFGVALTLALVAIALVATIFHRELRDAAIRRAAG